MKDKPYVLKQGCSNNYFTPKIRKEIETIKAYTEKVNT